MPLLLPRKGATMKTKKKGGYSEVAGGDAARGGVFFREAAGVTANAIAAKLRGEGKISKADPRKASGFGADGVVGVAIYPPSGGWLAAVDSADGAAGIGAGEWSSVAIMANHLCTEAIWYRVYDDDLALAARFVRGSQGFSVVTGDVAAIEAWLHAQGVPRASAAPPKGAPSKAVTFSVRYEEKTYRSGPDRSAAAALAKLGAALEGGDARALAASVEGMGGPTRSLALGVVRGATRGRWAACVDALAATMLARPMTPRAAPKEATLEEVVLARAAELAAGRDEARVAACVDRIDAIERDAEQRSDWAQPATLSMLAGALQHAKDPAGAFRAYARVALRKNPHWMYVNNAAAMLLATTQGPLALDGLAGEAMRVCDAWLAAGSGSDAHDAIAYNLACVYARAGDAERALATLAKCKNLRSQNAHPETDTDFASLWKAPAFVELLAQGGGASGPEAKTQDEDGADEDEAEDQYTPPAERAVSRQTIRFTSGGDAEALVDRIGGLPNVPSAEFAWPESAWRPMQLIMQLVGKAAGGQIDMGDVSVLQVFADMGGDYYEDNRVMLHRTPCCAVAAPPPGVDAIAVRGITLTPGADDRVLLDVDDPDDEEALVRAGADADIYERARRHAWADKIGGIAVGANLDPHVVDSRGEPMHLLLELVSHDDWFLWTVFVSADFREAKTQIVRG
jgi:hypothetical protein